MAINNNIKKNLNKIADNQKRKKKGNGGSFNTAASSNQQKKPNVKKENVSATTGKPIEKNKQYKAKGTYVSPMTGKRGKGDPDAFKYKGQLKQGTTKSGKETAYTRDNKSLITTKGVIKQGETRSGKENAPVSKAPSRKSHTNTNPEVKWNTSPITGRERAKAGVHDKKIDKMIGNSNLVVNAVNPIELARLRTDLGYNKSPKVFMSEADKTNLPADTYNWLEKEKGLMGQGKVNEKLLHAAAELARMENDKNYTAGGLQFKPYSGGKYGDQELKPNETNLNTNKWFGKYKYMDDFEEGAKKGDELSKKTGGIYDMMTQKYVVNNTGATLDTGEKTMAVGYMNKNELQTYNYILANEGIDRAREYLKYLEPTLNTRKGLADAQAQKEKEGVAKYLGATAMAVEGGLSRSISGFKQVPDMFRAANTPIAKSYEEIASEAYRKDITNPWGKVIYDLIENTSNMAPTIALSTLMPIGGGLVGSTAMGLSAAGNTYTAELIAGRNPRDARRYALIIGALEGGLQYALGGIDRLGGLVKNKVFKDRLAAIGNGTSRALLEYSGDMLSEGFEEGLQEVLAPIVASMVYDEEYTPAEIQDVMYSALIGALSSGVIQAPSLAAGLYNAKNAPTQEPVTQEEPEQTGAAALAKTASEMVRSQAVANNGGRENIDYNDVYMNGAEEEPASQAKPVQSGNEALARTAREMAYNQPSANSRDNVDYNDIYMNNVDESEDQTEGRDERLATIGAYENQEDYGEDVYSAEPEEDTVSLMGEEVPATSSESAAALSQPQSTVNGASANTAPQQAKVSAQTTTAPAKGFQAVSRARQAVRDFGKTLGKVGERVIDQIYNEDVDHTTFIAEATRAYNQGYYGNDSARSAKPYTVLDSNYRDMMFRAGQADANAAVEKGMSDRGRAIVQKEAGLYTNENTAKVFSEKETRAVHSVLKSLGLKGIIVDAVDSEDAGFQGFIEKGTVIISSVTKDPTKAVIGHEITHRMQELAPEEYKIAKDFIRGLDEEAFDKEVEDTIALYKEHGVELSYEEAGDEYVADYFGMIISDKELLESFAEVSEPSVLKKFINALKNIWNRIVDKEIRDDVHEAIKLLENVYKASVAEAANAEKVDVLHEDMTSGTLYNDKGRKYSYASMSQDYDEGIMFEDLKGVIPDSDIKELKKGIKRILDFVGKTPQTLAALDMNENMSKQERIFFPYKPNSDDLYKVSLDFSTMCTKRLVMQSVISRLQMLEGKAMSPDRQIKVKKALQKYQEYDDMLLLACHMCYVEAARFKTAKPTNEWLKNPEPILTKYFAKIDKEYKQYVEDYKKELKQKLGYEPDTPAKAMSSKDKNKFDKKVDKLRKSYTLKPAEYKYVDIAKGLDKSYFLTPEGLTKLKVDQPVIYDAFISAIRSATRSKTVETQTPYYYGDSKFEKKTDNAPEKGVADSRIEQMNAENGLRFSSWSDWQIKMALDMMSAVIDLSVRGAKMHGYTKFPAFVRVFGKTGMMFNLSGVLKTTDVILNDDGTYSIENFDNVEGINIEEAIKLRDEFPETAGVQVIGVSDEQILAMLKTDWIDYIIPYHSSGLSKDLRTLAGIEKWTDYTQTQEARPIEKMAEKKKEAKALGKDKLKEYYVEYCKQEHPKWKKEKVDEKFTIDEGVKAYIKLLKWHEKPDFSEWMIWEKNHPDGTAYTAQELMKESSEKYIELCEERGLVPAFQSIYEKDPDNYWKLLVDRKMINQKTGELIIQQPVKPYFDYDALEAEMQKELDNYEILSSQADAALAWVGEHATEFGLALTNDVKRQIEDVKHTIASAATQDMLSGKRRNSIKRADTNRFSTKQSPEQAKNLVALHNITEAKLLKALKLGGFPMPSIAVTLDNVIHSNFGSITLLFGRNTIDPKADRRNVGFSADVWSPTFPRTEYEANPQVQNRFYKMYSDLSNRYGEDAAKPLQRFAYELGNKLDENEGLDGLIESLKNDNRMKKTFLYDQGYDVPKPVINRTETKIDDDLSPELIDILGSKLDEVLPLAKYSMKEERDQWIADNRELILDAVAEANERLGKEESLEDKPDGWVWARARTAAKYRQDGGVTVTESEDYAATQKAISDAVNQEEYEQWLNDLLQDAVLSEGVWNGKSMYTPAGNRRSFKQLHYPVTLENIVKAMSNQDIKNVAGFQGVKTLRGAAAVKFKSVDEMHKYEHRLQNRTPEEAQELVDSLNDRLNAITTTIRGNSDDYYNGVGNTIEEIAESKDFSVENIYNTFTDYYRKNITEDVAEELSQLLYDISEMPTNLYEIKPKRVVGIDEIFEAIIPEDASQEIIDALNEAGIQWSYYDGNSDASRNVAINRAADKHNARFSISRGSRINTERLNKAKGETKRSSTSKGRQQVDLKKVDAIGREWLSMFPTDVKYSEIRDKIRRIADMLNGLVYRDEDNTAEVEAAVYDLAKDIMQQSYEITNPEMEKDYKTLKSKFKGWTIAINSDSRRDIPDDFIKENRAYAKFRIMKKGESRKEGEISPEAAYNMILEQVPYLEGEDYLLNDGQFALAISDLMQQLEPEKVNPFNLNNEWEIEEFGFRLSSALLENDETLARTTFADKKYTEIQGLKKQAAEAKKQAASEKTAKENALEKIEELVDEKRQDAENYNKANAKNQKKLKDAESTIKKLNAKNEALVIEIEKLKSENKISRRSKTKKQIDINLVDKAGKKWLDQFANKVKYADIRGRVLEVAREVSKAIFTENVADALEDAMMVASPLAFDMAMETLGRTGNKGYINPFDVEVYELADEIARELILSMTSDPNLYNKRTKEDVRKDEAAATRKRINKLESDLKETADKLLTAEEALEVTTGALEEELANTVREYESQIMVLETELEVEKAALKTQSKAMKKMLDKVKSERDKAQQRADHLKETADKKRDKAKVKEQRDRLESKVKKLSSLLRNPTDDKHVPEQLRAVTAQVLSLINMSSSEMRDAKGVTKKTIAFQELRNYYIENYTNVVIDDSVFDAGGLIDQVEKLADKSYMDMTEEELISCIELVDAMSAAIKNYNKLFATERWSGVHEISNRLREDNGSKKTPTKLVGALGALQKLVKIDMMEPLTYFHNLGEAGDGIFRMLRDAQDKFTTIVKMASDFSMEVTKGIKPKKLEKLIVKVKLGGKEVKMPMAHLMNLYVLSKRPSGLNHILNGGIKQSKRTKGLKVIEAPVAIKNITMEELNEAFSKIPAPAIAVADALQKFVSITLGDIQNEASLSVFGIKKFNEEVYWRIRVDKSHLKDDVTQFKGDVTTIRGMGHAKALKENASQPVIIESIFDAFSGMVVDGAKYAAYLKVTVDVDRIRNYKFDPETESEYSDIETMKELLDTVYGSGEGTGYLRKLLSDISSGVSGIDAEAGFTDKLVSNFKGAAIGANLRVVIQQPTALLRAVEAIGAGYFVGELPVIDYIRGWKRAVEHSPIAQWKDWGYFDVQTGRQIKDVLFRTLSNVNKVKEASMILVGAADSVSWGCIWMACENKVKHTRKDLKVNTDEYFAAVNEIFTDVIDRTQVVDGVLQRTQVMRSANPMVKQATSFMAEPMKQWNMMIRSLLDIANKKKGAKGHFLRTVVVLGASVTLNAAAQSVMDAIRDDNREEKWLEKWLRSMFGYNQNDAGDMTDIDKLKAFAFSNLGSTLNAGNYIPYVKDVFSLLQGYEIKRMDFDNISKFIKSGNYLLKALKGEGETTVQSALVDFISYGAQVTGMPLYNLRREILTWAEFVANQTDDYELQYMLTAYKNVLGADTTSSKYYDLLWKTLDMNSGSYDKVRAAILNTLIADGMTEAEANKKIVDQLSKRLGSSTTLDMMLTSSLSDFEAIRADAVDKLVKAGMSESDANKTVVKGLAQRMKNAGLFSQLHDTTDQASYEAIYNDALDRVLAAGYQLSDSAMSKLKEQGATASEIEAARREAADAWLNNQVKGKDKTFMALAAKSAYEQYTTALKSSSVYTNLDASKQAKVDDLAKQLAEGKGDQYAKLKAATDAGVSGTNLLLFEAALKASDKNGDGKYNQMEFIDAKNMGAISASDARLLWTAWQVSWSTTKNQQAFTMEEVEASKKYADWRAGK